MILAIPTRPQNTVSHGVEQLQPAALIVDFQLFCNKTGNENLYVHRDASL
jgi:hypothetical protein